MQRNPLILTAILAGTLTAQPKPGPQRLVFPLKHATAGDSPREIYSALAGLNDQVRTETGDRSAAEV